MDTGDLANKKIAVLGLGMEGVSVANFLGGKRCRIILLDKLSEKKLLDRAEDDNDLELIKLLDKKNNFINKFGKNYLDNLKNYDIIFRSPGIPYRNQKIQQAEREGVEISSQIKLFFDLCPCPIIGVTGTKGKGTVSSLIFEILKMNSQFPISNFQSSDKFQNQNNKTKQYKNVFLAGNIGVPAVTLLGKIREEDLVILELSSFQLQDLEKSPYLAVVLNISVDHLDYHKNEVEYREAKLPIVKYQTKSDYAVINQDYLTSFEFAAQTEAEVYYFSNRNKVDRGAYIRKCQGINSKYQKSGGELLEVVMRVDGKEEIICRSSEIKLVGRHNLENIAVAAVTAKIMGADAELISQVVKNFKGLHHRLELVAEINNVRYYNDSFATNPEPTMAAIDAFGEDKILIIGGSSKEADFSNLAEKIARANVETTLLIGAEAEKIKRALDKARYSGVIKMLAGGIDEIVNIAQGVAKKGDVVIFSPACASFDMFKNYKDRGIKYIKAVEKLNEK